MIKPTSKASLKTQCIYLCNLDIDKAERMYDFLIKDMTDIPDVEPASKPFIQNFGEQASGIFDWIRQNEDVIKQGIDMVRGIAGRKAVSAAQAAPLPPING